MISYPEMIALLEYINKHEDKILGETPVIISPINPDEDSQ